MTATPTETGTRTIGQWQIKKKWELFKTLSIKQLKPKRKRNEARKLQKKNQ